MVVKVCGLTSLTDAEHAVESGADMVGFIFEPTSRRYIADRSSVTAWETSAKKVAVFGQKAEDSSPGFDLVQAHDLAGLSGIQVIRPKPGESVEDLLAQVEGSDLVVLDKYDPKSYGGTGELLDWGLCAEFVQAFSGRAILAGGLNPDNVVQAISRVQPWGVDACSGTEQAPGVKDHEKVRLFVTRSKGS